MARVKEVIIDFMDDFIDDKYYMGPDKPCSEIIVNLENYVLELLKGQKEVTITFKREDD